MAVTTADLGLAAPSAAAERHLRRRTGRKQSECQVVTFVFHLSAVITNAVIAELTEPVGHRVDIRVEAPSTAWLFHPDQIKWVAAAARQAFERVLRHFPACTLWRVLYAGPAPIAVAIGQQINPTMYPAVQLYEYRHKEAPRYRPRHHAWRLMEIALIGRRVMMAWEAAASQNLSVT